MGNNALKLMVAVMITVLVMAAGQSANAQEFRKELMKGIFQTIGPDVFKDMAKSMAAELTKNEEFRKQVIQQVIQEVIAAIGPENMKDIVKSVATEAANANEVKIRKASCPTAAMDADSVRAMIASTASEFTKNPGLMDALKSGGLPTDPQALLSGTQRQDGQCERREDAVKPRGNIGLKKLSQRSNSRNYPSF